MNFIVIISDTLRRDHLGCYGNEWISTPNIDRFAERSLVLDSAYSASFPTVPHRRDLMTGRFTASYTPWAPLDREEVVLQQVLSDAGYVTMMVCDCPHIIENGYHYDRGFKGFEWIRGQETDRWRTHPESPEYGCDPEKLRWPDRLVKVHRRNTFDWRHESDRFVARTMTVACDWLEDNYQRDKFFLYVDTFDPHEPWDAPQWYVDMYDPGYSGEVVDYPCYAYTDFLTESELKHCRALYAAEVFKMSVTNALGCGQQGGFHESYRGVDIEVNLLKKVRLEIAVNEDFVKPTVDAITEGARGLFYGNPKQLWIQLASIVATALFTAIGTLGVLAVTKYLTRGIRVTTEAEIEGPDSAVHGERAFEIS